MSTVRIAVAGKGGTGKTTFAALLIRELVRVGNTPVLAVDADPNAGLGEVLGLAAEETVAGVQAELAGDRRSRPEGMSKADYLSRRMRQAVAAGSDVHLLVLGTPEGPGCYCHANNLLRGFIDQQAPGYPALVLDNPPGLEHLSRRTTRDVDHLFVISDATVRGVRAAARIHRLARRLDLGVGRFHLVVNGVRGGVPENLGEEIAETGLAVAGVLPYDPEVVSRERRGMPLVPLPEDSPAAGAVREMIAQIL